MIEDCLNAVLEAGRREFGCTVVFRTSAEFLVEGGRFIWPEGERNA